VTIFPAIEATKAVYAGQLVDETGTPVPASVLTSGVLTLYDLRSGSIINGRNGQNILNANNVTIDASGNITWTMAPTDHPFLGGPPNPTSVERHIAFFTFVWPGSGGLEHNVAFDVARQRPAGT